MNKETIFTIDMNEIDNPFERQKLESLPSEILAELLVRHLKREKKAIEYIEKNYFIVGRIEEIYKILKGEENGEEYSSN